MIGERIKKERIHVFREIKPGQSIWGGADRGEGGSMHVRKDSHKGSEEGE